MLDSAAVLSDLASPPGNRLEPLEGDREGQHSIRINDQFRKRMPVSRSLSPRTDETKRTSTVERIPSPTGYDLDAKWDTEWEQYVRETALQRVKGKVNAKHYQIFDAYVVKAWPTSKVTNTFKTTEDNVFKIKSRIASLLTKEISALERNAL